MSHLSEILCSHTTTRSVPEYRAENSTSRDDGRQKEQIRAFDGRHGLTSAQVEEIAQAGRGKFYRHFQHGVWDAAKP